MIGSLYFDPYFSKIMDQLVTNIDQPFVYSVKDHLNALENCTLVQRINAFIKAIFVKIKAYFNHDFKNKVFQASQKIEEEVDRVNDIASSFLSSSQSDIEEDRDSITSLVSTQFDREDDQANNVSDSEEYSLSSEEELFDDEIDLSLVPNQKKESLFDPLGAYLLSDLEDETTWASRTKEKTSSKTSLFDDKEEQPKILQDSEPNDHPYTKSSKQNGHPATEFPASSKPQRRVIPNGHLETESNQQCFVEQPKQNGHLETELPASSKPQHHVIPNGHLPMKLSASSKQPTNQGAHQSPKDALIKEIKQNMGERFGEFFEKFLSKIETSLISWNKGALKLKQPIRCRIATTDTEALNGSVLLLFGMHKDTVTNMIKIKLSKGKVTLHDKPKEMSTTDFQKHVGKIMSSIEFEDGVYTYLQENVTGLKTFQFPKMTKISLIDDNTLIVRAVQETLFMKFKGDPRLKTIDQIEQEWITNCRILDAKETLKQGLERAS